ncbi:MAG: hypothetical protein IAF38_21395 [Bacteroidia bacterium]|nr:hypothetical protein [Bacteroidia bacterium]
MKRIIFSSVFILVLMIGSFSCKKPAGSGGNSSLNGKIWVRKNLGAEQYAGYDEDVYIIYGDDIGFSDRTRAGYDGKYEFKYLRKGKYKIYAYSIDSTFSTTAKQARIQEVEITDKKQAIEVPVIIINK